MRSRYETVSFEGGLVSAMGPASLHKLVERGAKYRAACAERGVEPNVDLLLVAEAAQYFIDLRNKNSDVKDAWDEFSKARILAMKAGYKVPALASNVRSYVVLKITDLLMDAATNSDRTDHVENQAIIEIAIAEANDKARIITPLDAHMDGIDYDDYHAHSVTDDTCARDGDLVE